MTCAQGLLRLLWGGARSWSATGLTIPILPRSLKINLADLVVKNALLDTDESNVVGVTGSFKLFTGNT